jgi:hypothetical protein
MKNIIKDLKKSRDKETHEIVKDAIEIFMINENAPEDAKDCIFGNTIILEEYPRCNIPQHCPAKYISATRDSNRVFFWENGGWHKLPEELKKHLPKKN